MAYTLNDNLKRWAEQYETAEFIQSDPVQIPHRYDSRVNIEISAFVTAWIAWGSRKQIIQKADFIDREIFKGAPYHYIVGTDTQGTAPEWKQYKGSKENFYRTFTYADFHDLCARLFDVYSKFENMEKALRLGLVKRRTPDLQTAIEITDRFAEIFPDDPTKGDFALFGYGVNNGKVAPVTTEPEPEKEQPTAVADLSIADVLKMRLFYDNRRRRGSGNMGKSGKSPQSIESNRAFESAPNRRVAQCRIVGAGRICCCICKSIG